MSAGAVYACAFCFTLPSCRIPLPRDVLIRGFGTYSVVIARHSSKTQLRSPIDNSLKFRFIVTFTQRKNRDTLPHSGGIARPGACRHHRRHSGRSDYFIGVHQPPALEEAAGLRKRGTDEDRIRQSGDSFTTSIRKNPWFPVVSSHPKPRLVTLVDSNDARGRRQGNRAGHDSASGSYGLQRCGEVPV